MSESRPGPESNHTETEKFPAEVITIIAKSSHDTWMKQAHRDKGVPMESMSPEVAPHDIERATDALEALDAAGYKIVPK